MVWRLQIEQGYYIIKSNNSTEMGGKRMSKIVLTSWGIIIPHANRKQDFIAETKEKYKEEIIELYDDYGIVIKEK